MKESTSGISLTPERQKSSKSRKSTNGGEKSNSNRLSWGMTYISILVLICIFFIAGVYIGSLLTPSDSPESVDSGRNMLSSVTTTSSVTSYVNNKGNHLRQAAEENSRPKPILTDPVVAEPAPIQHLAKPVQPNPQVKTWLRTANKPPIIKPNGVLLSDKSLFLHVQEEGYMIAPSDLDREHMLVTAWVYLDNTNDKNDKDMRTIFSNKLTGCEASPAMYGFAVFVNAWQTNDHRLYLEYGGDHSGCNKLSSPTDVTLQVGQWYHIGVYLSPQKIMLLVDGTVVASQQSPLLEDIRKLQTQQPLLIGRYTNLMDGGGYPFFGKISSFAIVHFDTTESDKDETTIITLATQLQSLEIAMSIPGITVFYPLEDAVKEANNAVATEVIHGKHGHYSFPMSGNTINGVNIKLIDGIGDRPITAEITLEADRLGRERREKVKDGMRHAWNGYKRYAWGKDELSPLSNNGKNNWGGLGMTLVDSLDTLWVMGLKAEFNEARDWVASSLTFDHAGTVSVFEITIRMLGGLLSAYDLSQESVFLEKAKNLGNRLIKAFNTRSGIPTSMINLPSSSPANGWSGNTAILSELGTLQVEFRYLAHATQDKHYEDISMKPMKLMTSKAPAYGLYPIKVRIEDGGFADSMITFGALGDSFYEYLLKLWIQGGKKEKWLRDAYDKAMNGAITKLLMASTPSGLAFLSDWNGRSNFRKMDHLVCFMPGLLALGAYTDPTGQDSERAKRDLSVAKALMYTCREMYHRQLTGIAPEYVEFPQGRDMVPGSQAQFYILRPETAESLFILNQLTGDPIYREWAWEIWLAIDKRCRTNSGYASIPNVNSNSGQDDRMESFFLAETMKYLYLAQDPDRPIDLSEYVFNTEAHPMRILKDHKPWQ